MSAELLWWDLIELIVALDDLNAKYDSTLSTADCMVLDTPEMYFPETNT